MPAWCRRASQRPRRLSGAQQMRCADVFCVVRHTVCMFLGGFLFSSCLLLLSATDEVCTCI